MAAESVARWHKRSSKRFADSSLMASTRAWFFVVVVGQLLFAAYIVTLYGLAALHAQLGNRDLFFNHRYIPGDRAGNAAVAVHILFALVLSLSGAMQLVPQVRARAPIFHRMNGRLLIVGAFLVGLAGLYLTWFRHAVGDLPQHIGISINAILIMLFSIFALRAAMNRNFAAHRRWALRLFMVVSSQWFFRLGFMFWAFINRGPVGFDENTFTGPFLTVMSFADYLVPLIFLELYLRTQTNKGVSARLAMSAGVFAITLVMCVGIFAAVMGMWLPPIQAVVK